MPTLPINTHLPQVWPFPGLARIGALLAHGQDFCGSAAVNA